MSKTIRLTVGQAVVRFIANQYAERDGRENRFIEGIWGIFGHGNVSGLGQGIVEFADKCGEILSTAARTRHGPYRDCLCEAPKSLVDLRLHDIHWSRSPQHGHRSWRCHR